MTFAEWNAAFLMRYGEAFEWQPSVQAVKFRGTTIVLGPAGFDAAVSQLFDTLHPAPTVAHPYPMVVEGP